MRIFVSLCFWLLLAGFVYAKDPDGKYSGVDPAIREWIANLHSVGSTSRCCQLEDGQILADTQWDFGTSSYRVFLVAPDGHTFADGSLGKWFDVPPDAIVAEPNRLGHALVWTRWYFGDDGRIVADGANILCFLPGAGV